MESLVSSLFITHDIVEDILQRYIVDNFDFIDMAKTKYFFCLCINYFLAAIWRQLPNNPKIKHCFSILIGLWICGLIDRISVLSTFISALIVYVVMIIFPTNIGRFIGSAFAFILSTYGHIYRLQYSYMKFTLDWTLIQMLLTQKLTMYCFDIHDGTQPVKTLIHSYYERHRIVKRPTLIEYFGWIYFFPALIVGPMHPLNEYLDFVSMQLFKDVGGKVPKSAYMQGILRFVAGFAWLPLFVIGTRYPLQYCLTAEFAAWPFFWKVLYQVATSYLFKPLYYFAWLAAEGALIVMGYGFNGVRPDGSIKWDRATNVRVFAMEFSSSVNEMVYNWNIATQQWLKFYVYVRLVAAGYTKLANPLTYVVSAFWHGFYPGYYMLFAFGPVVTFAINYQRKKLNPYFIHPDGTPTSMWKFYQWICTSGTQYFVMYALGSMTTLNWDDTIGMFSSVYWCGHIALVCWLIVLFLIPIRPGVPTTPKMEKKKSS